MAKHVHAENMAMFAEDAKRTDKPWELWETSESKSFKDGDWVEDWEDLDDIPDWHPDVGYRRKIQTITIEGIVFPIPYKGEVVKGQKYYYVDIYMGGYIVRKISNDGYNDKLLKELAGKANIFTQKKYAEMRVKALRELDKKILGNE